MAKLYETIVLVDSMIPDEAIESEFDAIAQLIEQNGKLILMDKWGRRKLAYDIHGRSHGEYAVFYYNAGPDFNSILEKRFRINENILRWMTLADSPWGVPEEKKAAVEESKSKEVEVEVA